MTTTLAVVGKGGTGKTTFAALTIKYLLETGRRPILAIDGDPSSNLNLALGLPLEQTVGQIREETKQQVSGGHFPGGHVQARLVRLQSERVPGGGRWGGPPGDGPPGGAYLLLRRQQHAARLHRRLGNDYAWVVIDNEAGMEHISRQTTRDVDVLFVISDPTYRGISDRRAYRDPDQGVGHAHRRCAIW